MSRLLRASAVLFVTAVFSAPSPFAAAPDDELPDGPGKKILQSSCTTCHDLTEVTKFRGYYTKEQWRDIVATMVEYGAKLKEGEAEVLTEYLAMHLGPK
jgi:cytochrome c5